MKQAFNRPVLAQHAHVDVADKDIKVAGGHKTVSAAAIHHIRLLVVFPHFEHKYIAVLKTTKTAYGKRARRFLDKAGLVQQAVHESAHKELGFFAELETRFNFVLETLFHKRQPGHGVQRCGSGLLDELSETA